MMGTEGVDSKKLSKFSSVSSKTMQAWFLNMKLFFMRTMFALPSISRCSRILIYLRTCFSNFLLFLIILSAVNSCFLWSRTLRFCPKEPLPITLSTSYQ